MNPPPSTPTPRRFLLPRRSTRSSSQTPAAPPRFQSTPRFGSSSVPRPTQQRRELEIEDVEDDVEDEEEGDDDDGFGYESSEGVAGKAIRKKHELRKDAIDIESDGMTASPEGPLSPVKDSERGGYRGSIDIDSVSLSDSSHSPPVGREPKRRRVSISPVPIPSSPTGEDQDIPVSQDGDDALNEEIGDSASEMSVGDSHHSLDDALDTRTPHQPIFQPAPRFKPVEVDDAFEGLPAPFSPQRKGAKYIAGGLVAELQGWLSEVKGWEGIDQRAESSFKIHVDEVRRGKRMYLIKGHFSPGEMSKRWILAGEGKLTGLGRRPEVKLGSVVMVGQPVWDVELDGETWNVACDWTLESS